MRHRLVRELLKQFTGKMQQDLPEFVLLKSKPDDELFVYRCRRPQLNCYVALQVTEGSQEHFTVEVAWTKKSRYPFGSWSARPGRKQDDDSRFRLSVFWSKRDPWWVLAKEIDPVKQINALLKGKRLRPEAVDVVAARIPKQVNDAVAKIKRFAVPYFDLIAGPAGRQRFS